MSRELEINEDHMVEIYYYIGQEKEVQEWVESWKKKGYEESFRAEPTGDGQGGITLTKKIIPKSWDSG